MSPQFQILSAALPHIPFDGWDTAVRKQPLAEVYFPRGGIDAIIWHSKQADAQMTGDIAALPLSEMRVPQKIKEAIMLRLRTQLPYREAVRKALAVLSFPTHSIESLQLLYATVDSVWHAIGDTSIDFNYYTKRLTLMGIYSTTLLFWLNDDSPNLSDTAAFLDRRLKDVQRIGQAKAQCMSFFASPGHRPHIHQFRQ